MKKREDKENMLRLTGYADKLLNSGQIEVYEMTYEKLCHILKPNISKFGMSRDGSKSAAVKETDDSILDMFADSIDDKTESNGKTQSKVGSEEGESSHAKGSRNGNSAGKLLNFSYIVNFGIDLLIS